MLFNADIAHAAIGVCADPKFTLLAMDIDFEPDNGTIKLAARSRNLMQIVVAQFQAGQARSGIGARAWGAKFCVP